MEQTGEYRIPASRLRVWQALNDPQVLARCIEGCHSMTPTGDGEFEAEVGARVGPVKAAFTASITLSDVVPPESYRLEVQVKGRAAGFAKGNAAVRLIEAGADETVLKYRITGSFGGKLAQIGSRLVQGAARSFTARFFERFAVDMRRESASNQDGSADPQNPRGG